MTNRGNKNIVLLIPALDPPGTFPGYVNSLVDAGFKDILVVDDGSSSREIFDEIKARGLATIISHEKNHGKGRALKTGFSYYKDHFDRDGYCGIITLDCDGQHLLEDVQKVCSRMQEDTTRLILGCRDFSLPQIPPKSKYGNRLTARIFKLFFRMKLSDTQTGLRGIPNDIIDACLDIPGERFEYETSMLIQIGRHFGISEVPITTVYLEENQGTHFNPVKDSVRIYYAIFGTFFRYLFSSLSSFLVDIALFALFAKLIFAGFSDRLIIATVCARIISAVFNFIMNRNVVFKSREGYIRTGIMYAALCVVQMALSAGLVNAICHITGFEEVIIKMIVDVCLFFISFIVQKRLIFKGKSN